MRLLLLIIILLRVNICLRFRADCSSLEIMKTFVCHCLSWSDGFDWRTFSVAITVGSRGRVSPRLFPVYTKEAAVSSCLNKRTTRPLLTFSWHWELMVLFYGTGFRTGLSGELSDQNTLPIQPGLMSNIQLVKLNNRPAAYCQITGVTTWMKSRRISPFSVQR